MRTGAADAMAGGSIFGGKGISLEKDTSATFDGPTLSLTSFIVQMKLEGPPLFNGQKPRAREWLMDVRWWIRLMNYPPKI